MLTLDSSSSALCARQIRRHANWGGGSIQTLGIYPSPSSPPPPPGRPKFNDLRCGNKRQSKPASSVAEPAREAPRPQQVAVARHWPNANGHPSQTVDGRNIRTPADMSRPPFPPISMLSRDRLGHGCSKGSIISSTRPTSPRDLSNIAVGGKGGQGPQGFEYFFHLRSPWWARLWTLNDCGWPMQNTG